MLESAVAATVGAPASHPVDMAFAGGSKYLYSLANVAGIRAISVSASRSGTLAGMLGSLPRRVERLSTAPLA